MPRAASHASTARAAWYALPCSCLQLGIPEKPGCIPNSCSRCPEGCEGRSVPFWGVSPAGNRLLPPMPGPLQAGFRVSVSEAGPLDVPTRERGSSADARHPASRFPRIGFQLRTAARLARNAAFRRPPSTCKQVSEFRYQASNRARHNQRDTSTSPSEDRPLNRATTTNRATGSTR
jgi:hypothetical protein